MAVHDEKGVTASELTPIGKKLVAFDTVARARTLNEKNQKPVMQQFIGFVPRMNSVDTVKGAEHLRRLPDANDYITSSFFETYVGLPVMYCNDRSTPLASDDLFSSSKRT